MATNHLNRVYATIANSNPGLLLQYVTKVGNSNTAFRVSASHATDAKLVEDDYGKMVLTATDNKFRLVPETIESFGSRDNTTLISILIEANVAVKDFNEDEIRKGYRTLSANVFMDDENDIWKVVESNGTKHLVQSIEEDFSKILASKIARKTHQVITASFNGKIPSNGDYVAYYNTDTQSTQYGYALIADDIIVVDRSNREPIKITSSAIVDVIDGNSLDNKFNLSEQLAKDNVVTADDMGDPMLGRYLAYYKNLFGNTEYYAKLEKLIKERRRATSTNITPVMTTKLQYKKS